MIRLKPKASFHPRLKALSAGVALGLLTAQGAHGNPTGPSVAHGAASFARPDANTLNITNTPNAIINWQRFSIGAHETTRFIQQSAASRVLNRVQGGSPSAIMGRLLSNGRVFLINPSGIVFGPGSVIDTAGFLASTLDIKDRDFIEGRFSFDGGPEAGGIDNQGYIRSGPGGEIILIAPEVENSGIIETDGGRLLLAAGRKVTLTSLDDEHISFEVQAPEDRVVNLGELIAGHGSAEIFAGVIEHKGTVSADSVTVDEQGRVVLQAGQRAHLEPGSRVSAAGGDVSIRVEGPDEARPDAGFAALEGEVRADGVTGGKVDIKAERILATGTVSADGEGAGGRVDITAGSRVLATAGSRVSASGRQGGGGNVNIHGGDSLYTSGDVEATGQRGGRIELTGDEVKLAGAAVDASGSRGGGHIRVGGGRAGGEGVFTASSTWVNRGARLAADAGTAGDGGTIVVWGDAYSNFAGHASARGGSGGGDGGLVEISAREVFDATGSVDVSAPRGDDGTLVLDPKNFVIEPGFGTGATTGAGVLSLVDPNPGAGDNFGAAVSTIDDFGAGLLWVMNPNDDLSATDSGALYAFNTVSGELVGAVVGANANDRVGSQGPSTVGGSTNRLLSVPNFNGGQGLVTRLDPTSPPTGVLGTGNSLVGVGSNPSIDTFSLGNGRVILRNPNVTVAGNANAGFLTIYDMGTPITGTVSAANSLVGANADDFLGNFAPTTVSGGSNRLLRVPNFNANQGAITAIDPFNFTPGTVSSANSLVGVGNASVDTFSLGSGLAIVRNGFVDVGGITNAGFLTVYDVDSPVTGTVGAANSLVGSNASDFVGANSLEFVSGSTKRFFQLGSFNLGQGAVMAVDPFNFAPGAVTAANTFTGVGSPRSDTFVGGGNVLLNTGFADVGGITDAGFVTVFNVDAPLINQSVDATNSLVGANANDRVGGSDPIFVSGSSKRFLEIPNFNGGQGAVTTIDPFNFTPGTVGAGNSLLDVGDPSTSFVGNGLVVVRNPNFDANGGSTVDAGFVTVYDVEAPIVGSVDSANSLVGANDSDRVGSDVPQSVSGSSKLVLEVPNYNAGEGAITTIDPFAFAPGVLGAGNSFTGVGNANLDTFNLGSGLVVVRRSGFDPGGRPNAGFISVYDVENPTTGAVDLSNSLIGANAGDLVGSDSFRFVSGAMNWLLEVPNFNGGQGAVTAVDPFNFAGGLVEAANSFTGVGNPSTDTFLGSGNVLLANGFVDVGGVTNAGFATVVNVDALPAGQSVDATNSLVGANANDRVGSSFPSTVSGSSKRFLAIPDFNGGQGALTTIDPLNFIPGTVGSGNSLVGVGNASVDGFSLGGGLAIVRNGFATVGGNADAGFLTIYDVENPLTGAVSATNSLVGGSAGDRVGSTNPNFVSGSTRMILQIPSFNGGQGAVTAIDPFGFQPGTVSTANSLAGTAGSSINSFLGGGIVEIRNATFDFGGNADAGFLSYYDVNNPFTGTVGTGNALIGSHAGDFVGNASPAFITGSNNRLFRIGNYDGSRGAVKAVDPFNFSPGLVTDANTFTGTGDSIGFQSLGNGDLLLYGANADVGGTDRGFVTRANIDILGNGSVSATNSLVGANDNDRVGSNGINFVSGNNKRLLNVPGFNGGQGAVAVIDPDDFVPGVMSSTISLVGTGNPSINTNLGNGNVLLMDPFADVGGLSDNGYATTFNVDSPPVGGVSAANSLVGVFPDDRIGSAGIAFLSTGNVLVRSPLADGGPGLVDAGRLDILDVTGISGGSGGFSFASDPGGTVRVGAGTLAALLASGTDLQLQANNDITTLLGAFIDGTSGSGTGGSLALEAGRRITINDGIMVDGDLALLANLGAVPGSGVQGAFREAGSGDLIINDAEILGHDVDLAGANVSIDPSTVSAKGNLFAFASNNFSLLDESSMDAIGTLEVLASGDILVRGSEIFGTRVMTTSSNLSLGNAGIFGRDLLLTGANVSMGNSTVSAEGDLFAFASQNFGLLDDSTMEVFGDLGILALGNILVRDSEIFGRRVMVLGADVTLQGAPGTSPSSFADNAFIEGFDLAVVGAVGEANVDATFRPAIANRLANGVTTQEFADVLTDGFFTGSAFEGLFSSLTLDGGTLSLLPGATPDADALIVAGQGQGPAILGFRECLGCLPRLTVDPFFDGTTQAGIWANPILTVLIEQGTTGLEISDELLRLLAGSEDTLGDLDDEDGEDDEEDEEGEDLAVAEDEEGEGEQELQECR